MIRAGKGIPRVLAVVNLLQAYSYLEVTNEIGKITYDFEMTFSAPPPPLDATNRPPYVDGDLPDDADSDNIGLIVGSVVAVVVVMIIVIVVVLVLWKKEMACFASTRSVSNFEDYFSASDCIV